MDGFENIGGISIGIGGDYSGLQSDLDKATQVAADGGKEIAQALNAGAAGADALAESMKEATTAADSFESRVTALVESGSTLAEAIEQVQASMPAVGQGAEQAADGLDKLDKEVEKNKEDFENLKPPVDKGSDALAGFADKLAAVYSGAKILDFLKSLVVDSLQAADAVDDAGKAMALLSGNAEQATGTIDHLRTLANDAALGMPELLQAAVRMTAFEGSSENVADTLRAIADSAAVMGTSIDGASGGFERITASGNLSARSLQRLGLTMDDVAKVVGLSGEQLKKAFEGMDQSARVEVMVQALGKFKGAAHDMSDDSIGSFQRLKNQFFEFAATIGNKLEPLMHAIGSAVTEIIFSFQKQVVAVSAAVKSVVEGAKAVLSAMRFDSAGYTQHLQAMRDQWQKGEQDLAALDVKHQQVNATVQEGNRLSSEAVHQLALEGLARKNAEEATKKQAETLKQLQEATAKFTRELPASFDEYAKGIENGSATAKSALSGIEGAIQKAMISMEGLKGKPLAAMQAVVDKLEVLRDRAKQFAAEDDWNKAAVAIASFATKYENQLGKLDAASLNLVNDAMATARGLKEAFDPLADAKFLENFLKEMQKADDEIVKLDAQFKKMAQTATASMDGYKQGVLQVIPITVGLGERIQGVAKAYLDMQEGMNKAGFKTQQQMESLLKTQQELLAAMVAMNQPIGFQLEQRARILETIIKEKEATGASATSQIIALKNITLQQQALYDQTHLLGDLYSDVLDELIKGWMKVSDAIVDAIFEGKNFGQSMLNLVKQVGKAIMSDLVTTALKYLKDSFIGVGKSIQDATKDWEQLTKAMNDAAKAITGANAAGGAKGAGGGGALGAAGAISSIATAISSIFGNLQLHAVNKSLDVIVNHTLRIYNVLDQWYTAAQDWFNQEFTRLGEIWRDMNAGFQAVVQTFGGGSVTTLPYVPPKLPFDPGAPQVPEMGHLSATTYNTATSSSSQQFGAMTFNVFAATDPRETARQIASTLKNLSPKYAAYGA